jgi:hypothetical protein
MGLARLDRGIDRSIGIYTMALNDSRAEADQDANAESQTLTALVLHRETWLHSLLMDDLKDLPREDSGVNAWHPDLKNSGSLVLWPSKMNPCSRSWTSGLRL